MSNKEKQKHSPQFKILYLILFFFFWSFHLKCKRRRRHAPKSRFFKIDKEHKNSEKIWENCKEKIYYIHKENQKSHTI